MNPFADGIDAEKYDSARPNFHPLVFERLAGVFRGPFAAALDVGCGTGQSTKALASVSAFVVGSTRRRRCCASLVVEMPTLTFGEAQSGCLSEMVRSML